MDSLYSSEELQLWTETAIATFGLAHSKMKCKFQLPVISACMLQYYLLLLTIYPINQTNS